jgi:hypothetical protein
MSRIWQANHKRLQILPFLYKPLDSLPFYDYREKGKKEETKRIEERKKMGERKRMEERKNEKKNAKKKERENMEGMRQNMKKCKENERHLLCFISTEYRSEHLQEGFHFRLFVCVFKIFY